MKEKLIELLEQCGFCTTEEAAEYLIAAGLVLPTKCKDCKYWVDGVRGCTDHVKCCKIGLYMVGENGYCVYGERKTDDNS